MTFKRFALAGAILAACVSCALAQGTTKPKSTLQTEVTQQIPDNASGAVNPSNVRQVFNDSIASFQQAPQVNPQVGTSYTFLASDYGNLVTFNNATAVAVTLPQATGSFFPWNVYVENKGAGTVTITPSGGSTINGASTLTVQTGGSFQIVSDGTNYQLSSGLVANSNFANMAANLTKCNATGSAAAPQDCAYIVPNNTALQALATTVPNGGLVFRAAFSSAGDGGQAYYTASGSACALNAGNGDNGWQVKSADSKCWIASFPATGADVRAWGAVLGSNVDTPLNAAVNFACSTHVPIFLPYPLTANTFYLLNSSIVIGNGSSVANSTCNGVQFSVTQPNVESAAGVGFQVAFKWNGVGGIIPFVVQGPASKISLRGVGIDCNATCSTGFKLNNVIGGIFEYLGVWNQTNGPAFYITTVPSNVWVGGFETCFCHHWKAIFPGANGSGMQVGETTTSGVNAAVINNNFTDLSMDWDGACATCYGFQLGLADQNTFINAVAFPVGGTGLGNSLKIAPVTGLTTFPTDNLFLHPQFGAAANDPGGAWTGTVGQTFIDYSIASAVFPTSTVQALYSGTDSKGFSYPRGTWTPTDGSGAALTLTTSDTTYVINNKVCTVNFNITYPITANASNAQINGLPCTPASTSVNLFGGAPSVTNQGAPFTILLQSSPPSMQFVTYASFLQLKNSDLGTTSGKTVRGSLTFPIQ